MKAMNNQLIFEKLNSVIQLINPKAQITEKTELIGESVLDSLEFMNYITKIEEAFSLTISDSEISQQKLGIVKNMINHISSKI
jgi:acyl carrier protein